MKQNKPYRSIAVISASIASRLEAVDKGTCDLSEMDELLKDMRELEERIIIIRYKGMERLQYPEPRQRPVAKVVDKRLAPELPLDTETIHPEPALPEPAPANTFEEPAQRLEQDEMMDDDQEPEVSPNQISLIDSIEEISKEASINERMKSKKKRSLAQSLQSKPLESVLKALNLNQKMGLTKDVFKGNEEQFKETLMKIDASESQLAALEVLNSVVTDEMREEFSIVKKLESLIKRRFI